MKPGLIGLVSLNHRGRSRKLYLKWLITKGTENKTIFNFEISTVPADGLAPSHACQFVVIMRKTNWHLYKYGASTSCV